MERDCAGNTSSSVGTKRPPQLFVVDDDGAMANTAGEWTGTKKARILHQSYQQQQVVVGESTTRPSSSRKRPYVYGEHEYDVSSEKLYKCNYWEDPAYAKKIAYFGLGLARGAALDVHRVIERREFLAWIAAHPLPTEHVDMGS